MSRFNMTLPKTAVAIAGVTALGLGLTSQFSPAGAANEQIAKVPAAISAAVPALKGPSVSPPAEFAAIFGGTLSPSPDVTANVALARPLKARVPGAAASWVVPTQTGACLVVADTDKSLSVGCRATDEIASKGLAATIKDADANGNPKAGGLELGIGGPRASADGSFAAEAR